MFGWVRVILVGDIDYYKRFGFSRETVDGIYLSDIHSSERLLGNELIEGSISDLYGPVYNFRNRFNS